MAEEGADVAVETDTNYVPKETATYIAAKTEVQKRMNYLNSAAEDFRETLDDYLTSTTDTRLTETSVLSKKLKDILGDVRSLNLSLPSDISGKVDTFEPTSIGLERPSFENQDYSDVAGVTPENIKLCDYIDVPEITDIPEPVLDLPDIPGMPNISDELTQVRKPDLDIPDKPEYKDVETFTPPEINIPDFEFNQIDFNGISVPDTNLFYTPREFELSFTTRIEELLAGRNGLNEETENAIWARARARNDLKNEKMYRDAEEYFASRGFELPTGAFNSTLQDIRKEISRSEEQMNYEIAAESSRIAHEFTKAYAEALSRHEGVLADIHNNEEQRFYDSIKSSMQYAIDVFNTQAQHIRVQAEYEQLRLQEFESKLKAEISKIDIFRTQIESAKLTSEQNRNLTEQYKAAADMTKSAVEIYVAELEAVRNEVANNEQKVNSYRAQLEAIGKKTEAELSKVSLYNSKIDANKNKVDLFNSQMTGKSIEQQTYNSYLSAVNSSNSLAIENARAKANIEQRNSEGQISAANASASIARSEAEINHLDYQKEAADKNVKLEEYKADVNKNVEEYKGKLAVQSITKDVALANLESSLKEVQIRSDELSAKTQSTAQLIASSLNSLSVSASIGSSAQYSDSVSESHSHDETKGEETHAHHYYHQED